MAGKAFDCVLPYINIEFFKESEILVVPHRLPYMSKVSYAALNREGIPFVHKIKTCPHDEDINLIFFLGRFYRARKSGEYIVECAVNEIIC